MKKMFKLQRKIMNFKQHNQYVLLDGLKGESIKALFLSIQYENICNVTYFFTYYAWKPMHMGSTKFKCESLGNYCEFVK